MFLGRKICATHVQLDELGRTPDLTTKADLLQIFTDIAPASLTTDTPVWDETKWPSDDGLYEALLRRIRVLDKKNKPLNQSRDARIAETAIRAGLTLVTDDPRLSKATLEHGGKVLTLAQFSTLPGPHG